MSKARILLVEDEPFIQHISSEVLDEAGLEVVQAVDAEEALLLLEVCKCIDLLLTDVHMPGSISGLELARQVRVRHPDLQFVLITRRPETVKAFGHLGRREVCLAKPFSPLDVVETVTRLLRA